MNDTRKPISTNQYKKVECAKKLNVPNIKDKIEIYITVVTLSTFSHNDSTIINGAL